MKRKRLDRDIGWGFQGFPYYQFRLECGEFRGLCCLIDQKSGKTQRWSFEKAGEAPVAGGGMKWLQLLPDGKNRLITAMFLPSGSLSVCYVDVIERVEFDPDGVAAYVDKYLDVVFTPQGDCGLFDRDELDEALDSQDITKAQYDGAISEAESILSELCGDLPKTVKLLKSVFRAALERISLGEEPLKTKYQEIIERGLLK